VLIILILLGVFLPKVSMSNPNQTCFTPEPGDTNSFGFYVVINDKYLAIGDPSANHVIIYTRDNSSQWIRTKEVLPPKNSTPSEIGYGFGRSLQLDKNILVINALTQQDTKDVTNPKLFQYRTMLMSTFFGRYLVNLDSEIEPKEIKPLIEKEQGFVRFNLLSEGKIRQITLSDNGEKNFGSSVALHQNLLLVGSPPTNQEGKAWLFDINNLDDKPLELKASNILMGGSVAISEKFVVVGSKVSGAIIQNNRLLIQNDLPIITKTLIKNLKNNSTTIVDGVGTLSLSGNILARIRPGAYDGDLDDLLPLLEVFRLDDNAVPHLIQKRRDVNRAWVQNGYLITTQSDYDAKIFKVCIEPIS
ncbi:MAG: hypothetical protein AAGA80_21815, partial [Cyanobacteria bacterium P01_F01_bin.143]